MLRILCLFFHAYHPAQSDAVADADADAGGGVGGAMDGCLANSLSWEVSFLAWSSVRNSPAHMAPDSLHQTAAF